MPTQTKTQRQTAAKKAAATRKQTAAKRSTSATKASARRTARSAGTTTRSAERTAKLASRSAGRRLEEAAARLDSLGRQVERTLLIQIGATAAFREAVTRTARTYTSRDTVARELGRFERRGAKVVNHGQRVARRTRTDLQRDLRGARRRVTSIA